MQTEDLAINQCGQWQIIKQIREEFPNVSVAIFAQAFIVKSINLGDLTRLVVTAQNGDSFAVAHLERHQQRNCFNRIVSTIYIITHEQVIGVRGASSYSEQFHQIMKLAVYVATYCNRTFHLLYIGFLR